MKVKELLKKVNYATCALPIYLKSVEDPGVKREAFSWDFAGYHFDEQDRTVASIDVQNDKLVILFK